MINKEMSQQKFYPKKECNRCGGGIWWNKELMKSTKPLDFGTPNEHKCPAFNNNQTTTTIGQTYTSTPNPNNYTGSSSDYDEKLKQLKEEKEILLRNATTIDGKDTLTTIMDELEFTRRELLEFKEDTRIKLELQSVTINKLADAVYNFINDNPIYRAQLQFQAQMFPILKGETSNIRDFQTADKLPNVKDPYHDNDFADMDPDYDKDYIKDLDKIDDEYGKS